MIFLYFWVTIPTMVVISAMKRKAISAYGMKSDGGKAAGGFCTFVFKVDDLQKTYDEITAKGITIPPIKPTDWGGQEMTFEDPDGNKIILLT